ncbi:hypothetical protein FQN60_013296 [Etheostoma spectabile]|uniref:Ig-like domain-containing protein n=1 Tax=Etheostoma spectabile TaxID=54343 RepID=A0A5J5DCY2_9PERO|nr:hypothetical protein FQN60_013296 [Etheostoma spectabile]
MVHLDIFVLCFTFTLWTDFVPFSTAAQTGVKGVEVPWSQDEHFAGRVHWDKDVLTEGRLRLHVSRLRTEDSGLYKCYVETSHGRSSGVHFDLSVLICGLFAGFLFILCFGVIKAPSKSQNQPAAVKHLVV